MFEIVTYHGPELKRKIEKLAPRVYLHILAISEVVVLWISVLISLVYREYLFAGLLVFFLGLTLIRRLISYRKYKQANAAGRTFTTSFGEDWITSVSSDNRKSAFSYDQILGVYDSDCLINLEVNGGTITLDKAGFQKGTPEELLAFLASKTANRTKSTRKRYLLRGLVATLLPTILIVLYLLFAADVFCACDDKCDVPREEQQNGSTVISINESTRVDVGDRIREVQTLIPAGTLLDSNKAVLALDKDVYISLSAWEIPTSDAVYYLPLLIYRDQNGWATSWYGDESVDLSGSDPSPRHTAGDYFVQTAGDKIVINIGVQYLTEQKSDSSILQDSLGGSPKELSAGLVDDTGNITKGWLCMSSLSGELQSESPQFIGMTPMEDETGLVFVVQALTDDYLIQCGEWKVTGAEIRSCLENPDE